MVTFDEMMKAKLTEGLFDVKEDLNYVYPYLNKVAEFLGIDKEDLYQWFGESLAYETMEELEAAKAEGEIDEKEYEIHKKFFEAFGKDEFQLTDEDLTKIGTTREDYEKAHDDLVWYAGSNLLI